MWWRGVATELLRVEKLHGELRTKAERRGGAPPEAAVRGDEPKRRARRGRLGQDLSPEGKGLYGRYIDGRCI